MILSFFQIDAFSSVPFSGNPAAVYPLQHWLPDTPLQAIAMEHQLAETAFFVPSGSAYELRWFSPETEVDLCGHATLASAHVFFNYINTDANIFEVYSKKNGVLKVFKEEETLFLDFPTDKLISSSKHDDVFNSLGLFPIDLYEGRDDLLAIFKSESDIKNLNINIEAIKKIDKRGVIATCLLYTSPSPRDS